MSIEIQGIDLRTVFPQEPRTALSEFRQNIKDEAKRQAPVSNFRQESTPEEIRWLIKVSATVGFVLGCVVAVVVTSALHWAGVL